MSWSATFKQRGAAAALAFALALALAPARARAGDAARTATRSWPATAVIRFAGSSTLHDFGGQLPPQAFILVVSNGTWSAEAAVRSSTMTTENAKRDRRMFEMMEAEAHPLIRGRIGNAIVPGPGGGPATLGLRIREREVDLPVRVSDWAETPDRIRFHATWELSLKAYGLQPPTVAGLIRVADRVRLEADVTALRPSGPDAPISPTP